MQKIALKPTNVLYSPRLTNQPTKKKRKNVITWQEDVFLDVLFSLIFFMDWVGLGMYRSTVTILVSSQYDFPSQLLSNQSWYTANTLFTY